MTERGALILHRKHTMRTHNLPHLIYFALFPGIFPRTCRSSPQQRPWTWNVDCQGTLGLSEEKERRQKFHCHHRLLFLSDFYNGHFSSDYRLNVVTFLPVLHSPFSMMVPVIHRQIPSRHSLLGGHWIEAHPDERWMKNNRFFIFIFSELHTLNCSTYVKLLP